MNPFCIPFAINNMGGALLAMDLGFMGPNYSISTACATGNYCILRHLFCQDTDILLMDYITCLLSPGHPWLPPQNIRAPSQLQS